MTPSTRAASSRTCTPSEFLGTYIIGPILVRNPELCKYFVHKLIGAKDPAHTYLNEDYAYEEEAYNKTVNAE